jgi:hypothetical protein
VRCRHVQQFGDDRTVVDDAHMGWIVNRNVVACEMMRRWDFLIRQTTECTTARFR